MKNYLFNTVMLVMAVFGARSGDDVNPGNGQAPPTPLAL